MEKSFYDILQVLPDASPEVIRAAYRSLSAKYHPDKDGSKEAAEQFAQVQLAFETLSDANRRARYDEEQQSFRTIRNSWMETKESVKDGHAPEDAFPLADTTQPFENTASHAESKESLRRRVLLIASVTFMFLVMLDYAIHRGNSPSNKMTSYSDINSDSGITAYKYGNDWIQVQFKDGRVYQYQAKKIGQSHIDEMKRLADSGDGLNTYISTNQRVKHGWSSKSGENEKDGQGANRVVGTSPSTGASNTYPHSNETERFSSAMRHFTLTGRWETSTGDILDLTEANNQVQVVLVKSSSWNSGAGTLARQGNSLTGDLSGVTRDQRRRTWKFAGTITTGNQIDFTVDFYLGGAGGRSIRGLTLENRPVRSSMRRDSDTPGGWYKL